MLKDSKNLIDIYRRYLEVTGDLVTILERNYEKAEQEENGLKAKRLEFIKHAEKTISQMHDDVHKLFRLSWELRGLEKGE